jgi:hypothetical protein
MWHQQSELGRSDCPTSGWKHSDRAQNDLYDVCMFGDIPKTGGKYIDGDAILEMKFERHEPRPEFKDSIKIKFDTEATEAYTFYVADYVYTPPGTRGGDLPPEYGISVMGAKHDDCDEIGSDYPRWAAQMIDFAGDFPDGLPQGQKWRDLIPDMTLFTLKGADGVSAGRICGIPNLFSFHRISDTRWSK